VALLPGHARPRLAPGQQLRLELSGFRYSHRDLEVESVGDGAVTADEIRRYLGPEQTDTMKLTGPLVLVRARLPERTFVSEGKTFNYDDGMQAQARVRVQRERLLFIFVPALKAFFKELT
jgi:membrane fusion protein (multidrug efflux system)